MEEAIKTCDKGERDIDCNRKDFVANREDFEDLVVRNGIVVGDKIDVGTTSDAKNRKRQLHVNALYKLFEKSDVKI